jgi:hypothetical protein
MYDLPTLHHSTCTRHHLLLQVRDGGNLLTRAGLALPSVDFDEIVARYQGGPSELVDHLRVRVMEKVQQQVYGKVR